MKKVFLAFLFVAISAYISACGTTIPIPQEKDVVAMSKNFPNTKLSDLLRGRELYVRKCSGCHTLKNPSDFTSAQWEQDIPDMKTKAKIKDDEAQAILLYVLAYAKDSNQISSR
ncbi:MAG: hypothetical protein KGZ58_05540 [Ignavibacteriales bacterium]|nr:hypothetical protein [Ignavibacteriales bacterium]